MNKSMAEQLVSLYGLQEQVREPVSEDFTRLMSMPRSKVNIVKERKVEERCGCGLPKSQCWSLA